MGPCAVGARILIAIFAKVQDGNGGQDVGSSGPQIQRAFGRAPRRNMSRMGTRRRTRFSSATTFLLGRGGKWISQSSIPPDVGGRARN